MKPWEGNYCVECHEIFGQMNNCPSCGNECGVMPLTKVLIWEPLSQKERINPLGSLQSRIEIAQKNSQLGSKGNEKWYSRRRLFHRLKLAKPSPSCTSSRMTSI